MERYEAGLAPSVAVVVGGRELVLTLNLGADRRFKQATGHTIPEALGSIDVDTVTTLVWAMAAGADRTLTVDEVAEMLSYQALPVVTRALTALVGEYAPEPATADEAAAAPLAQAAATPS